MTIGQAIDKAVENHLLRWSDHVIERIEAYDHPTLSGYMVEIFTDTSDQSYVVVRPSTRLAGRNQLSY